MKKFVASFVLCSMLGVLGLAMGGLVSKPFTFVAGKPALSSEVNANFDSIYNEFNGGISDANISPSAAIQQSKISSLLTDLGNKLGLAGGTLTGDVKLRYGTPCVRLTGTEASALDWSVCESAGSLLFRENTGSENSPVWTTRYSLAGGAAGPAATTDLTTKSYVDSRTATLGFSKVVKTDGDFNTSATTFTDVTGLTATISTGVRRARVTVLAMIDNNVGAVRTPALQLQVDGVDAGGTGGIWTSDIPASGTGVASFSFVTDVLTAASHTFKLQIKNSVAASIDVIATTTNPAYLTVEELPY